MILKEYLAVFFGAMLPVFELRGAIPLGIALFKLPPLQVFILAVAGNIAITAFILLWLPIVSRVLMKYSNVMNRLLNGLFQRTQQKHAKRLDQLGYLALFLFVAIPLPGTGAWTGSLVAYVFGLKSSRSLLIISAGIISAGVLVTLGSLGLIHWI